MWTGVGITGSIGRGQGDSPGWELGMEGIGATVAGSSSQGSGGKAVKEGLVAALGHLLKYK